MAILLNFNDFSTIIRNYETITPDQIFGLMSYCVKNIVKKTWCEYLFGQFKLRGLVKISESAVLGLRPRQIKISPDFSTLNAHLEYSVLLWIFCKKNCRNTSCRKVIFSFEWFLKNFLLKVYKRRKFFFVEKQGFFWIS
jgi:hypothetical protein